VPASGGILRYLKAKGSLDARSVNLQIRKACAEALTDFPPDRPLRVIELGGGAGGGFGYWMSLLAPFQRLAFTAADRDGDLLEAYREEVASWAGGAAFRTAEGPGGGLRLERDGRTLDIRFREMVVPEGFGQDDAGAFDLVLGQSFWDLLPPGTAVRVGERLLAPRGIFYSTLTFSGATRFGPGHELDRRLLHCYHASMGGERGGDPYAGERLIGAVRMPGSGFTELASGRSDWRVVPTDEGYPGDEGFFLLTVLGFIEKELLTSSEVRDEELDWWMSTRRRQLRDAKLSYAARQQDLVARRDG
jgi:SAM-dependent methyltransferase